MSGPIERKYLSGIKFRSAKPVKTEEGICHQTTERALQPEDVLSWVDRGPEVVLVAADGRKHVVAKAEAGLPPGGATSKPAAGKAGGGKGAAAGGKAAAGSKKGASAKGKAPAGPQKVTAVESKAAAGEGASESDKSDQPPAE